MDEETRKRRSLFRPKKPELKEQCRSCPFRKGNDKEFGEIVAKLEGFSKRGMKNLPDDVKKSMTDFARVAIKNDVDTRGGEFYCHLTVYSPDMRKKSFDNAKQCPGATRYWKTGR